MRRPCMLPWQSFSSPSSHQHVQASHPRPCTYCDARCREKGFSRALRNVHEECEEGVDLLSLISQRSSHAEAPLLSNCSLHCVIAALHGPPSQQARQEQSPKSGSDGCTRGSARMCKQIPVTRGKFQVEANSSHMGASFRSSISTSCGMGCAHCGDPSSKLHLYQEVTLPNSRACEGLVPGFLDGSSLSMQDAAINLGKLVAAQSRKRSKAG
jgi:hypothetical protein